MDKITCHVVRKWPDSNLSEGGPVLGNGRSHGQAYPARAVGLRWSRLFGQIFRLDKWIDCRV
jgi:hypothetical protein